MLQRELNTLRIKFYKDVEKIGFQSPVTDISEKTGYAKGNISSILNKKLQPSEPFLHKFYESFKKELQQLEPPDTNGKGEIFVKDSKPTDTIINDTPMNNIEQQDWKQAHKQLLNSHDTLAQSHLLLSQALYKMTELMQKVETINANLADAAKKQQIFRVMTNANQQVTLETLAELRGLNKNELVNTARSIGASLLDDTAQMDTVGS